MSALVQCMNLTKCYVKGKAPAVSDLNLTIERGHIVGLLGPNGSGKTTLIKMMNGLLKPTDGVVLIGGSEPGVETKKACFLSAGTDISGGAENSGRSGGFFC